MAKLFDRVKVNVATAGQGAITFGAASALNFRTPIEAGASDGDQPRYVIVDGNNVEEGVGTIFNSATQMQRTTITFSKINGVVGADKLDLSGTAVLGFTASAADIMNPADPPGNRAILGLGSAALRSDGDFARFDTSQPAKTSAEKDQLRANAGIPGRNKLLNGRFRFNQRGYASGAAAAAGSYGHDRWRAGASGGDYSFVQSEHSTQITIAAGKSRMQIIEPKEIEGGSYTVSWVGTCTARVGINSATPAGNFAVSPITISGQTSGTIMSVEFTGANAVGGSALGTNTGTLGDVQLEAGTKATPFEVLPYMVEYLCCARFCQKIGLDINQVPANAVSNAQHNSQVVTNTIFGCTIKFTVPMRISPAAVFYRGNAGAVDGTWSVFNGAIWANSSSTALNSADPTQVNIAINFAGGGLTFGSGQTTQGAAVLSAEY